MTALGPTITIDCRWLNSGGAGRVTELLLRALRGSELEARWLLWGPEKVLGDYVWPSAEIVANPHDPRRLNGQADWFAIPACDLAVFMHQQRPLRRVRSLTVVHDTIPLRFGGGGPARTVKRAFLRRVARISEEVLTDSEFSRRCIISDLGVEPERVTLVHWPADAELAARVSALRRDSEPQAAALYLGLFLPHKNLGRLVQAFAATEFRRQGGRLILMGGPPEQAAGLLAPEHQEFVEVRPFSSQAELEELLATVRLLVQPSLLEGFGLPAWEALACGVPVCAGNTSSLPEVTRGWAEEFDPLSVEEMTAAIDRCAARAAGRTPQQAEQASKEFLGQVPTLDDLRRQFERVLQRHLEPALASSERPAG